MKFALYLAAALAAVFVAAPALHAQGGPDGKVFVCKYVGTPGDGERLQTGQNPIDVSVNAIKDYAGVGAYFNDAQGRSYVLAEDTGQGEPSVSQCPGYVPPDETCEDRGDCPPPVETCEDRGDCPPPPEETCEDTGTCEEPPAETCEDTDTCPPPPATCEDTDTCEVPTCEDTGDCPPEPTCEETGTCPDPVEPTCEELDNCPAPPPPPPPTPEPTCDDTDTCEVPPIVPPVTTCEDRGDCPVPPPPVPPVPPIPPTTCQERGDCPALSTAPHPPTPSTHRAVKATSHVTASAGRTTRGDLPRTGAPLWLLGLMGVLSVAAGFGLRSWGGRR